MPSVKPAQRHPNGAQRGAEFLDGIVSQSNYRKRTSSTGPTEDALALQFITDHPDLRYVAARGKWFSWVDCRWHEDSTLAVFDEVRALCRKSDGKARANQKAATVAAVERLARSDRRVVATTEQWDADPWLLNTPSYAIDLRTGESRPHRRDDYCTKVTAVAPGGTCPKWMEFLKRTTRDDEELQRYLQRIIGYALTGEIRDHAVFFCYGSGGNGKGVFLNTLTGILADYSTVAGMETFTFNKSQKHPADLAFLMGARLVTSQETASGAQWDDARLKALTGGDPITARFMRQDFFTFRPTFKLIIADNHKPKLSSIDEAMRRRIHLIPFTATIPAELRDPDLPTKLKAEWPGILQWAVDGCLEYQREGLKPPQSVQAYTDEYFEDQDTVGLWLDQCCDQNANKWETPTALFNSWRNFAEHNNQSQRHPAWLKDELEKRGIYAKRSGQRGRYFDGLAVKPEDGRNARFANE